MIILGIETSCDETAVSIVKAENKADFSVLAHLVSSQVKIHAPFGGVVPNLAKREHQRNLPLLFAEALAQAKLTMEQIDAIAVTEGPGLEPALWVGITFAQELAAKWGKPLIPVNHMAGHIASVMEVRLPSDRSRTSIIFPALALLASGGHTELVLVKKWGEYEVVGRTRDDAAGEAFDKVARLLGLPYPGGSELAKLAVSCQLLAVSFKLPRPMINSGDLDFSFSGLKTAVRYLLEKNPEISKAEVAAEFQQAVIDVLIAKTLAAVEKFQPKTLIVAGGVAANAELQKQLLAASCQLSVLFPPPELTGDNATMIAMAAYLERDGSRTSIRDLQGLKAKTDIRAQGHLVLS